MTLAPENFEDASPSVRRVLDNPRPSWRGRMHKWMVPVAVVGTLLLVGVADSGLPKLIAFFYGLASIGLYAASALAHYKIWDIPRLHRLFLLDQSMIMAFIVASTAPVAYAVGGGTGWLLFGGMLVGATLGVVTIWLPFHPPRGFMNALFFLVAWWPIFFAFSLQRGLGGGGMALLLAGGAVFTIGALIVGSQRPDPNPHVFGYHEIWHVFVIVGNIVHAVLAYLIVTGHAPLSL